MEIGSACLLCSWGYTDDNMQPGIPPCDSFSSPRKRGHLQKLCGKGWLYSGSWKDRYCVLDNSKFYFYDNEQSEGREKSCGVISLDYYDLCEADRSKDHAFLLGTSVRGFFDNRHQFAAGSSEEMDSWIGAIRKAIEDARLCRIRPARKRQSEKKPPRDTSTSSFYANVEEEECGDDTETAVLPNVAKDRAKGPQGRRPPQRKSMMPAARSIEEDELRQRSASVSEEDSGTGEGKGRFLSISLEEVDREDRSRAESQRSSSAFHLPPRDEEEGERKKRPAYHVDLLGRHQASAFAKELQARLKAHGKTDSDDSPEEENKEEEAAKSKEGLEGLSHKVETSTDELKIIESRVNRLTAEASVAQQQRMGDLLLQVTVTLKEAERMNEECRRALAEANLARDEYQALVRECKKKASEPHEEQAEPR